MAPSLLPELVSDILLCLPVASLLRFRCLSTSHCAEIDSPYFAKHQLKRSIKTRTGCKLLILDPRDLSNFLYADMEKDDVDFGFKRHWTHIPTSLDYFDTVDRSVNGLILLELIDSDRVLSFAVWNPFTKRHKVLPPCPAISLPGFKYLKCYGLGVDSALEEYKVVVIPEFSEEVCQVWIFSLESNCWRNVEFQHRDPFHTFSFQQGYFANGYLYWSCWLTYKTEKTGSSCGVVIGFDLTKEQLFFIPAMPHSSDPMLAIFEGNVYMPKHDHMIGGVEWYRLMCDEHGKVAGGNWVKEFTFNHQILEIFYFYFLPLRRSRKGDSIFFIHSESGMAFWCNLESKQVQDLEITCALPEIWNPLFYQESLVSPGHDSVLDSSVDVVDADNVQMEIDYGVDQTTLLPVSPTPDDRATALAETRRQKALVNPSMPDDVDGILMEALRTGDIRDWEKSDFPKEVEALCRNIENDITDFDCEESASVLPALPALPSLLNKSLSDEDKLADSNAAFIVEQEKARKGDEDAEFVRVEKDLFILSKDEEIERLKKRVAEL